MRKIKKAAALIMAVVTVFSMTAMFSSAEREAVIFKGQDVVLYNVLLSELGDYSVITVENQDENDGASVYSYPEKEKTKTFSHAIYDRNYSLMATFNATVTGIYSSVEHYATITSIKGTFTGDYADNFSYKVSYSGEKAYAYVYFSGVLAATFTYKLYTNGSLQNIDVS